MLIMAAEECYSDVLPNLWLYYQCDKSGIDIKVDSPNDRMGAWQYLLLRWLGFGVGGIKGDSLKSIPILVLHNYDSITGEFVKVDRKREDPKDYYVCVDEFRDYLAKIEISLGIRLPFPENILRAVSSKLVESDCNLGYRQQQLYQGNNIKQCIDSEQPPCINFYWKDNRWHIGIQGEGLNIQYMSEDGFAYIHFLLDNKYHEFEADELYHRFKKSTDSEGGKGYEKMVSEQLSEEGLHTDPAYLDTLADPEAINSVKSNLRDRETELEELDKASWCSTDDEARQRELESQILALKKYLQDAQDPKGKLRTIEPAQKTNARTNVYRTIKKATEKIIKDNPALQEYLEAGRDKPIKTGSKFSYSPDHQKQIDWMLRLSV